MLMHALLDIDFAIEPYRKTRRYLWNSRIGIRAGEGQTTKATMMIKRLTSLGIVIGKI